MQQQSIEARTIKSARLQTRVLFAGPANGQPVLFLHGNLSNASWWEEAMLGLPAGFRAIAPDQRGYGEADRTAIIDATRGLADLADDAFALLDALNIERAHVVASSLGGNVAWRMLGDHAERIISLAQVAPGSPYGFSCTRDEQGTLCFPDGAGSGASLIHPELVKRLVSGDTSTDTLFSIRSVLRRSVWDAPFIPAREDQLVKASLSTHTGERAYPGDAVASTNWPFRAPGKFGPNNALSPIYNRDVAQRMIEAKHKPPILWLRGARDPVVSDTAGADTGNLGKLGLLPGWPGENVYPPQPMLAQTRHVLTRYYVAGGPFREVVMPNTGHAPYLQRPVEFNQALALHLTTVPRTRP